MHTHPAPIDDKTADTASRAPRRISPLRELARAARRHALQEVAAAGEVAVELQRDRFLDVLRRLLPGAQGRREVELTIRGDGRNLEFTVPGASLQLPGDAAWHGTVICRAAPFLSLLRRPLDGSEYRLAYRDGRLCIGGWTVPARWQAPGSPQLELPIPGAPGGFESSPVARVPGTRGTSRRHRERVAALRQLLAAAAAHA